MTRLVTAESVTRGHVDKVADQISDAILDAHLAQDQFARVAVEALVYGGGVHVAGEVTSLAEVNVSAVVRSVYADIGYDPPAKILSSVRLQSADCARSVQQGAGDQGSMVGYATAETSALMPLSIMLAHELARHLDDAHSVLPWLRPDGKVQVTVEYGAVNQVRVHEVVVNAQVADGTSQREVAATILELVIQPALAASRVDAMGCRMLVRPFLVGGPAGDTGLTGRKVIVDSYGPGVPHGGGAFSGKDPSKMDRSGAYAARWVAKSVVAGGLADTCLVQLSYVAGRAEPVAVTVAPADVTGWVRDTFDLRPTAIIDALDLRRPIYQRTATYGHFGRPEFPWEQASSAAAQAALHGPVLKII